MDINKGIKDNEAKEYNVTNIRVIILKDFKIFKFTYQRLHYLRFNHLYYK